MRIEITNFKTRKPNGAMSEHLVPLFAYEDGEYYELDGGMDTIFDSLMDKTFISVDMSYTVILPGHDGNLQETKLKHMIVRGERQTVDRPLTGAWADFNRQEHFITFEGTKVMDLAPEKLGNYTTFTSASQLMTILNNIKNSSAHSISYGKSENVGHHK